MKTGFYIAGKLLGYKLSSFTNRETGEVREKHVLGVQLLEPDGYGNYNTLTQEVKLDEKVVNQGFHSMIDKFKGKNVLILVSPREWAMERGRKGITYNFDENSTIEELKQ